MKRKALSTLVIAMAATTVNAESQTQKNMTPSSGTTRSQEQDVTPAAEKEDPHHPLEQPYTATFDDPDPFTLNAAVYATLYGVCDGELVEPEKTLPPERLARQAFLQRRGLL
ncbi:MAG: hypothetical protein RJB39_222 [Candidatus Parcubacteria bacterium]|jgi:hypothetical protein